MTLVLLILIPLLGGLGCWQAERWLGVRAPRWIGLGAMLLTLVLVIYLWVTGDYSNTWLGMGSHAHWAFDYQVPWIPRLGVSIHFALDGLSLLLIAMTAVLGIMAVLCSWREVQRRVGFFYLNLLWNLAGTIGVFLAIDMLLFFFFWEMMLVPMFFMIALWGHNVPGGLGRVNAAVKFFIYTQASGLLMLLSILALVFVHQRNTGVLTFDYTQLLGTQMSSTTEMWIMLGFFIAFMVKFPVVPLHSWLPDAHSQAPTAGSVDLASIMLKTAAYGLIRFAIPLFPQASAEFAPVAMWLGVAGILYAAVLAFGQTDIKRLVAYTSISHMGFVLIAIYVGTEQALQGAMINILSHGVTAGALFILCGEIYERLHTRDLRLMGGLWASFPFLPPTLLFFALAAMGLPGTGNFIGEFLILLGSYKTAPIVTWVAATGLIVSTAYALIMVQRALHGPLRDPESEPLFDLNAREITTLMVLAGLLLWLGLYPQTFLDVSAAPMHALHHWYASAQTMGVAAR